MLRNRENLAAIRPMGKVLTMATMRFADEVVTPEELDDVIPEDGRKLAKRELEMARQLIESLSTDFDADKYRDEYREELLALIERKARGEEVVEAVSEEPKPTKAPDLMAALEESLAAVKGEPLAAGSKRDGAEGRRRQAAQADHRRQVRLRLQELQEPDRDREARPKPRSRRRRAPARAHQPRQGAVARERASPRAR